VLLGADASDSPSSPAPAAPSDAGGHSSDLLAKQLSNPVASLIRVF